MFSRTHRLLWDLLILGSLLSVIHFLGFYSKPMFRDFAIVFEGGYRLLNGQVPYNDFFIPMGPVIFYMQAMFMYFFGPNLLSMCLHSGALAILLCASFFYLITLYLNRFYAYVYAIALYFSFNGYFNYPFYSVSHAFFFFLITIVFILIVLKKPALLKRSHSLVICAILTVLSIFTRQDVGMMQLVGLLLFFTVILRWPIRSVFACFLVPTLLGVVGISTWLESLGSFLYWFNWGQGTQPTRLDVLLTVETFKVWSQSLYAYMIFFFSVLLFYKPNERARIALVIVIMGVVLISERLTSVNAPISAQGIPIVVWVIHGLLMPILTPTLLKTGVVFVLLLWCNVLPLFGRYTVGNILFPFEGETELSKRLKEGRRVSRHKPVRFFSDWMAGISERTIPDYTRVRTGAYAGALILKSHLDDLNKIRAILDQVDGDFLNLTEYQFLSADYDRDPSLGMPLAFHEGVYFQKHDLPRILTQVVALTPMVILLQNHLSHTDPKTHEAVCSFLLASGYNQTHQFQAPSMRPIKVFQKR